MAVVVEIGKVDRTAEAVEQAFEADPVVAAGKVADDCIDSKRQSPW